ncbi:MAG: cytochrome c [Thermoleophilia bacterium]|nr:cytochrome c [Thermoleophilia bacterium]
MLLAITSEGKVGLALLAGAFIAFALLSSFWFPRRNPDFPGNRLGLFVLVTVVLFVGTMAGVVFFAKEEEHGGEAAGEVHGGTGTGEEQETTGETTGGTDTSGGESQGDAAAGEQVFASTGCGGCHTLEAAGSSGNVGPNLDDAKPEHDLVVDRVTNGKGAMPSFAGQLSETQIQDVAAYVVDSTQG